MQTTWTMKVTAVGLQYVNYMHIKVNALNTAIRNVQVKNPISVFQPCVHLGFSEVLQYLMVDDQ